MYEPVCACACVDVVLVLYLYLFSSQAFRWYYIFQRRRCIAVVVAVVDDFDADNYAEVVDWVVDLI
jgi:hypothetical protein